MILYEFTLIKLGHFIKSTINILNEKLKFMNPTQTQRQTIVTPPNLDDDGSLVTI